MALEMRSSTRDVDVWNGRHAVLPSVCEVGSTSSWVVCWRLAAASMSQAHAVASAPPHVPAPSHAVHSPAYTDVTVPNKDVLLLAARLVAYWPAPVVLLASTVVA